MVPARPFFIGNPGWVRSSAWIWLFSSTAGAPLSVVGMALAMEAAKLVTAGWLATAAVWRVTLVALDCVDIGRRSWGRGRGCERLVGELRPAQGDGGRYRANLDHRAGGHARVRGAAAFDGGHDVAAAT